MGNAKEYKPIDRKLNLILAEDDRDDQLLFEEVIAELPVSVELTTFSNGDDLMEWLTNHENNLPDALFLDLNMPRKNGFAALGEIKRNMKLQDLPVIIFSTATNREMIKQVFKDAAHYYIRKPASFWELKELIYKSLKLIAENDMDLPGKGSFMLTID
ncbi:response regulator [Rhodohalobacter barkolensis]|uniref:Response regulator n=1 Tax=Rhodohalobacter barkolensis TaxID=2053187 RepID=A0A2N0VE86_9BACT|nr:response regulator [Rhodohalobacter barkolensis]PKD42502.1 response regulator [Rhodohalobacter barkolensis]